MQIMFLGFVFLTIIGLLTVKRPLWQAVLGGLVVTAVLFQISPGNIVNSVVSVVTKWSSLSVLVTFYLIAFLQKILEARGQIKLAQADLNGIFHNRRINAAGSSVFIGLMPSAAGILLCSEIIKDASDGYLEPKEQAFVASWFRHIPESILPTYAGVLLMLNLSGVEVSGFLAGMIVPAIVLALLGYVSSLRKIPKDPGTPKSENRGRDVLHLFQHLWSLLLLVVLILGFEMGVAQAALIVIVLALVVYRIRINELKYIWRAAFEKKLLMNTFMVMVLKNFISCTDVLDALAEALNALPLPGYLIFALMFFFIALISGSTAAIAMGAPLAFAAMPGSTALMVYLMCITHAAMQVSPTHVCLIAAADYFHVSLGELVRKTLPAALVFCVLMTVYYNLLVWMNIC